MQVVLKIHSSEAMGPSLAQPVAVEYLVWEDLEVVKAERFLNLAAAAEDLEAQVVEANRSQVLKAPVAALAGLILSLLLVENKRFEL